MQKKWLILFVAFALFTQPGAMIQPDFSNVFSNIGKFLSDTFRNEYATFGVVIVVLTILLRAIFAAGLKKVKIFEGSGGEGLNTFGNTISWTIAIMSSIAMFYLKGNRDINTFLSNVLGPAGIWAAVFLAVMLFIFLKGATGNTGLSIFLTGLFCLVASKWVDWPMMASAGAIMVIIGFFWAIAHFTRGRRPATVRDERRFERAEGNLGNSLLRMSRDNANDGRDEETAIADDNTESRLMAAEGDAGRKQAICIQNMEILTNRMADSSRLGMIPEFPNQQRQFLSALKNEIEDINKEEAIDRKQIADFQADIGKVKNDLYNITQMIRSIKQRTGGLPQQKKMLIAQEMAIAKKLHDDVSSQLSDLNKITTIDKDIIQISEKMRGINTQLGQLAATRLPSLIKRDATILLARMNAAVKDKQYLLDEKKDLLQDHKAYVKDALNFAKKVQDEIIILKDDIDKKLSAP